MAKRARPNTYAYDDILIRHCRGEDDPTIPGWISVDDCDGVADDEVHITIWATKDGDPEGEYRCAIIGAKAARILIRRLETAFRKRGSPELSRRERDGWPEDDDARNGGPS